MKLTDADIALFGRKSQSKKLFFSTHKGRKQMSMLLDDAEEGDALLNLIGGHVGRKERSKPIGALEWYYHGPLLIEICKQIHPSLNWFQQRLVGEWINGD